MRGRERGREGEGRREDGGREGEGRRGRREGGEEGAEGEVGGVILLGVRNFHFYKR